MFVAFDIFCRHLASRVHLTLLFTQLTYVYPAENGMQLSCMCCMDMYRRELRVRLSQQQIQLHWCIRALLQWCLDFIILSLLQQNLLERKQGTSSRESCFLRGTSVCVSFVNGLYATLQTKFILFLDYSYVQLPSCPTIPILFPITYFSSPYTIHCMSKDHSLRIGHTKSKIK